MLVPSHLKVLNNNATKFDKNRFKLTCSCGETNFLYAKNVTNIKDNPFDAYWNKLIVPIFSIEQGLDKKNGQIYWYGKTFFGIHVGKFYEKDIPKIDETKILKAKCCKCGREYVLFDSRYHGLSAIYEKKDFLNSEYDYKWSKNSSEIIAKVVYELTLKEFEEDFNDNSSDKYADAFTYIAFYTNKNNKKRLFFEEETS